MARTPLLKAVTRGDARAVRKALAKSLGGINDADEAGDRPLHVAARLGHELVVAALLENGAEVDLPNAAGQTALCIASDGGYLPCVEALLARGAAGGAPPMRLALTNNHVDVMAALIAHGVSGDPTTKISKQLLGACAVNSVDLVRLVLQQAQDGQKPWEGTMALHIAVKNGNLDIARALLEAGACPLAVASDQEQTPLHWACASGQPDMVILLLSFDPTPVKMLDTNGQTPLHLAASGSHDNAAVVAALLGHGAHACHCDNTGATALQLAAEHGNRQIAAALLPAMCNNHIVDHKQSTERTAVELAILGGHDDLTADLVQLGGAGLDLEFARTSLEPPALRSLGRALFNAGAGAGAGPRMAGVECAFMAQAADGDLGPLPEFAAALNAASKAAGQPERCYCCCRESELLSVECGQCSVARYCSQTCQEAHVALGHERECALLAHPEFSRLAALEQTEGVKKVLRLRTQWADTDADADARARAVLGFQLGCAYEALPDEQSLEQAAELFRLSLVVFPRGTPENTTIDTARARTLLRLLQARR